MCSFEVLIFSKQNSKMKHRNAKPAYIFQSGVKPKQRRLSIMLFGYLLNSQVHLGIKKITMFKCVKWCICLLSRCSINAVIVTFFLIFIGLTQVLKFNLTESGLFCVLPWLTMAVFANIGGWIADTLVSKGFSITTVRKVIILLTVPYGDMVLGKQ